MFDISIIGKAYKVRCQPLSPVMTLIDLNNEKGGRFAWSDGNGFNEAWFPLAAVDLATEAEVDADDWHDHERREMQFRINFWKHELVEARRLRFEEQIGNQRLVEKNIELVLEVDKYRTEIIAISNVNDEDRQRHAARDLDWVNMTCKLRLEVESLGRQLMEARAQADGDVKLVQANQKNIELVARIYELELNITGLNRQMMEIQARADGDPRLTSANHSILALRAHLEHATAQITEREKKIADLMAQLQEPNVDPYSPMMAENALS